MLCPFCKKERSSRFYKPSQWRSYSAVTGYFNCCKECSPDCYKACLDMDALRAEMIRMLRWWSGPGWQLWQWLTGKHHAAHRARQGEGRSRRTGPIPGGGGRFCQSESKATGVAMSLPARCYKFAGRPRKRPADRSALNPKP